MEYFRKLGLRSALLMTPFLLGSCTGPDFPTEWPFNPEPCQDGDVIGPDADGALTCVARAPSGIVPQPCRDDQVVTSEKGTLKCVNKGNGSVNPEIAMRIMDAQAQLNQLNDTVDNLQRGGAWHARYLGLTAVTTRGRITSGNKLGLRAAADLCSQQFVSSPTAHMCTVYEMYEAAATGQLKDSAPIPKAWVYMMGWNNSENALPSPSPSEGEAGLNENCANYHYPTALNKWVGTAVAWEPIHFFGTANEMGLKFFSGRTQAACYNTFPIACCD